MGNQLIFDNLVMNLSAEFKSVRDRSLKNGESLWRFTEHHKADGQTIGFNLFMTGARPWASAVKA